MRTLPPAPRAFVDPVTGAPAFGSYAGPLPPIDLVGAGARGAARGEQDKRAERGDAMGAMALRALRRKKWFYVAIASDEVWISLAVVRMGYATSAFAYVFDLASRTMLVDRTAIGPPRAAEIADDPHASGVLARFGFGRPTSRLASAIGSSIVLERRAATTSGTRMPSELRARFDELELDVSLDDANAPPAISAIAQLGPGLASATEKRALATVRGSVVAAGRRISLDGALGGYDYTHGLMPRHTRWKWAFAMGRAKDGAPVAFNVVQGFVGEAECAAFREGGVFAIHEPRFDFDAEHPERPWRLQADGMDLTFDVGAVHEQRTNLVVVRSRFVQPAGTFRGTVRIGGRDVELDGVPGVVEDQDVLW